MSPRMSAEDRREQVIKAAIGVFARYGYEGATTSAIAEKVGVSQPYLFRLFPGKKDLFITAAERNMADTQKAMFDAAGGKTGPETLEAMGHAYMTRLETNRESLLLQMQSFAACWDEDIQSSVRKCMQSMFDMIVSVSKAPMEDVALFVSKGMMCNVIAAADRSYGLDPGWDPILKALWPNKHLNDVQQEFDGQEATAQSVV